MKNYKNSQIIKRTLYKQSLLYDSLSWFRYYVTQKRLINMYLSTGTSENQIEIIER